jgi:two-component system phosphate regulon response regulator PhoB/two-component system alkaline phosphatase synthesis response regulator PhoP
MIKTADGEPMANLTVTIVDDEPDILELVAVNLSRAGFKVRTYSDVDGFYRSLSGDPPGLIILDLMLPGSDGFEICKYLKGHEKLAAIPIIMLTARTDEMDKVLGLELGADDYVTKPFSPRELVARVKAVLRRHTDMEPPKRIDLGGLATIDPDKYEVETDGRKLELTVTEFKILQLLASKKGRIFSREQILDHLWGQDKTVIDRTVDVHIRHLREKLGKAASVVKNVRGVGYKVEE